MSAIVCGKRPFFEDLQSPPPPSLTVSKRRRFSSVQFSPSPSPFDQLTALFPHMDTQILEKALEECDYDLDAAIRSLHGLQLGCADGMLVPEADGKTDNGLDSNNLQATQSEDPSVKNSPPSDGAEWVELFVREMMSATSIDDAKARATRLLESLEKWISSRAGAEAAQTFSKENIMLKQQIEVLLRDNAILKKAVTIQHERQKEYDQRNQELEQLKQFIAQQKEQLRTLEINNYALKMHLHQAQQSNRFPVGRFNPDVY